MRKFLSVMLALAMCVSLFGCGNSEPAETAAPATTAAPVAVETTQATEPVEDVVILYTNDVHTYIDGPLSYDVLAGLKDGLEATYGNVLLVDAVYDWKNIAGEDFIVKILQQLTGVK